jgi:hypothetical protein
MVRLLSVLEGTGADELGTFVDWWSTNADSGDAGLGSVRVHFFFPSEREMLRIRSYHHSIQAYTIISVSIGLSWI